MIFQGAKSTGEPKTVAVDDNGKLLVAGITLDNVTLDNIEIANDVGNPVPVSSAQLPSSLGAKTAANSLPVTLSTDGAFSTNFGAKADSVASDDTGAYSLISLTKRVASRVTSLMGLVGEVQASPTQYTVLDRLKSIAALLPAAFTSGGGVKVGLVDAVPSGTNLIGRVGSDTVSTATLSSVAGTASSTTILAANASRKRVVIVNDSTAALYLKFGATASATSYTYLLQGGDTYESPSIPVYTGIIDGIWASAAGAARVTEFT